MRISNERLFRRVYFYSVLCYFTWGKMSCWLWLFFKSLRPGGDCIAFTFIAKLRPDVPLSVCYFVFIPILCLFGSETSCPWTPQVRLFYVYAFQTRFKIRFSKHRFECSPRSGNPRQQRVKSQPGQTRRGKMTESETRRSWRHVDEQTGCNCFLRDLALAAADPSRCFLRSTFIIPTSFHAGTCWCERGTTSVLIPLISFHLLLVHLCSLLLSLIALFIYMRCLLYFAI